MSSSDVSDYSSEEEDGCGEEDGEDFEYCDVPTCHRRGVYTVVDFVKGRKELLCERHHQREMCGTL